MHQAGVLPSIQIRPKLGAKLKKLEREYSKMIEVDHLTKSFGSFTAVDDLSFNVTKGEVLGFLGPNGAGKSTTMKMIAGYLTPTSGTARVCGFDINKDPTARSTDNIVTLNDYTGSGGVKYNVDAASIEHLYDGTIIQGSGPTQERWDGNGFY